MYWQGVERELIETTSAEHSRIEYLSSEVFLNRANSLWLFKADSATVSGLVTEKYPNGTIAKKFMVVNGKKEGIQTSYYPDGKLKFYETFSDNRLHGGVKRWTIENGYQLLAELTYKHGKLHGQQKKWYRTGELHKVMHLNMGKEDGMQKAFRKNGVLYANYQARNGRVFGLKRSNLCYELDNEKVVYR